MNGQPASISYTSAAKVRKFTVQSTTWNGTKLSYIVSELWQRLWECKYGV